MSREENGREGEEGDHVTHGLVEDLIELLQLKDVQANAIWTL
jgi:hypothetical protein